MPPRNSELPEGTDHIVNGAMEPSTSGPGTNGGAGEEGDTGFIGNSGSNDDTGGTAGNNGNGGMRQQLRDGASSLKGQATDRLRAYADDGKGRATDTLDELARVVREAADSLDERLGGQYGDYARRAAGAVSDLATTVRGKEVDELLEDATALVRRSPAVAVGAAAAIGFALVRIVKAGLPEGEAAGSVSKSSKKSED